MEAEFLCIGQAVTVRVTCIGKVVGCIDVIEYGIEMLVAPNILARHRLQVAHDDNDLVVDACIGIGKRSQQGSSTKYGLGGCAGTTAASQGDGGNACIVRSILIHCNRSDRSSRHRSRGIRVLTVAMYGHGGSARVSGTAVGDFNSQDLSLAKR